MDTTDKHEEHLSKSDASEISTKQQGYIRRLYNWVLSWSGSPYGLSALAAISFAESSFFPIPPDVLQIAMSVARPARSFLFAAVSTVASVAGGIVGWTIGWALWSFLSPFFFRFIPGFTVEKFQYVESLYQSHAGWAIFSAAFTPIPFKIFTIAAGVCSVPLHILVFASTFGRGGRFFLVAIVMRIFGKQARDFLHAYLEWITLALGVLLIGGFFLAGWLMR